jgi:hypothetical protein
MRAVMRLWPDLLFASAREVSGHVVSIVEQAALMERVRALIADWRPA